MPHTAGMLLRAASLVVLGFVASTRAAAPTTSTDEPKPKDPVCTSYSGTVSGNDPSVAISGTLCEDAKGAVTGRLTWSSARSGSNVREVAGAWNGGHTALTMHDGAIVESHPNPGWTFCVVDEYDLAGTPDALSGSYQSFACHDHASVSLTKR
jgi:hypothetical protein